MSVDVAAVADEPVFSVGDGEDTITFRVSADEYRGSPEMRVMVNGEQVGSLISVTADHDAGEWQEITIRGDFGDNGARSVEVEFMNDAWGGSRDRDRNLYLDHISVNGERYEAGEAVYDRASGPDLEGRSRMSWAGKLVFDTSDAPELAITVPEDTEVALPISLNLTDTDGSESVGSVLVSGLPDGAALSAGTDNGDGTWSVDPGELEGLSVTPPDGYSGTFDLRFEATSVEGEGDTADATVSIRVHVESVADAASLSVSDASGLEDSAIPLDLSASLTDRDGSESLAITISGVPEDASLSAGVDNGDGSWTLTGEQLEGLSITPPRDFSGAFDLTVMATTTDSSGSTLDVHETVAVSVTGRVDPITIIADDLRGSTGEALDLGLFVSSGDTDGSESITVIVSGLPEGVRLSAGRAGSDGTWTLSADELDGLTLDTSNGFAGSFEMTITAVGTEADGHTLEFERTVGVSVAPAVAPSPQSPAGGVEAGPVPAPSGEIDWGDDVELGVIDAGAEIDQTLDEIDGQVRGLDLPDRDADSVERSLGYTPIQEVPPLVPTRIPDDAPVPPPGEPLFQFSRDGASTRPGVEAGETADGRLVAVSGAEVSGGEDPVQTVREQFARSFALLWGLVRSVGGRPGGDTGKDGREA